MSEWSRVAPDRNPLGRREPWVRLANHALACRWIDDGLHRLQSDHQQLVVLFIDLGLHPGYDGDNLACRAALHEIIGRLLAVIRASDTVTVVGGGRIVLTALTSSAGSPSPADILRDRCGRVFARPVYRHGTRFTVHPRIGAATAVAGGAETAEQLLARAVAAMVGAAP